MVGAGDRVAPRVRRSLLPLAQLVLYGPSVAKVWREFGALEGETEPAASLACAEAVVKELRDALGSYGLS